MQLNLWILLVEFCTTLIIDGSGYIGRFKIHT